VGHYGYTRDTADLDLLIKRENRERWLKLLQGLNYTVFQDKDAFVQLSPPPEQGAWPVDLMLVQAPTFTAMYSAAVRVEMYRAVVHVPALEHLIALKLHALTHGHLGRHLKDYLDVENLARINHLDLNTEKMRRLFEKHGTVELYEKLSRTLARE